MRLFRLLYRASVVATCGFLLVSAPDAEHSVPKAQQALANYDPQVNALLARMTLSEKIGQMTQADQQFLATLDDIDKYHLGSLLSGGDSDPKSGNDLRSWTELYRHYQERALKTRLRIPLLYGIDAVHGNNNVLGAVIFPQNIGVGCSRDEALVEKMARVTAEEVRATGINWAFAPCVTVPQDIRWGRTYEGYSEDPGIVEKLGAAAVRGLQYGGLNNPAAVLACAKHFAGDGGTVFGTGTANVGNGKAPLDHGDTRVDEATLRRVHLPGYVSSLAEGVGSIMPSYSSWNGIRCSGNKHLLTDILKEDLGFQGFLISDYAALNELPGDYKTEIAQSINAGMDMVMVPQHYQEFVEDLTELVNEGAVPLSRIDDAVRRILRIKFAMGLMDAGKSPLPDPQFARSFGSPEHRAVARQAVRESLVVLKNAHHVLPLAKNAKRIHVVGRAADDIGIQCGGWTITWQGKAGKTTQGTTILEGFRAAVSKGTQITYSLDGSGAEGASTAVVFVGEQPYAEMNGDRVSLALSTEDLTAIDRVRKAHVPVVVVLVSGRPLSIDDIVSHVDGVVAAWLPGSEGNGVADVLFGDYKPVGKLSFTWPKQTSTSLHRGDRGYKTLFPLGYGLRY